MCGICCKRQITTKFKGFISKSPFTSHQRCAREWQGKSWESEMMSNPSIVARRTVQVTWEEGLHMRPCSQIAQLAGRSHGEVRILKGERIFDAKSVMDLLGLAADNGTILDVEADGEDAESIADGLVSLFEDQFGYRTNGVMHTNHGGNSPDSARK